MFSLQIMNQLFSFLIVLLQLFVPELIERVELILLRTCQIVIFLVVSLLHLVDTSSFQVFFELLGHDPQVLGLDVVTVLLVLHHLS